MRVGDFFAGVRLAAVLLPARGAVDFFAAVCAGLFFAVAFFAAGGALLGAPLEAPLEALLAAVLPAVFAGVFFAGVLPVVLRAGPSIGSEGIAGLGAPNFRRTGRSPQISSRW